jgi:tetratricopeptide (TPR) repeat protein
MDLRKMKDEAAAFYQKGKFLKAIERYSQLISIEPKDARLRLRHAEACMRVSDARAAVASYQSAATLFAQQGQLPCARAALKLAVALQPSNETLRLALESVEQRRGH